MSEFDTLWALLAWLLAGLVFCQTPAPDPCTSYITLTDPTMDVSYTKITTTGTFLNMTTWYRYTNRGESILASSCPTGNACGTSEQVWMNGSVPSYSDGPVLVDTCFKDTTGCCATKGRVRARNCKTFMVYMLNPQYGGNRWCFDKVLRALPPVLTTTTAAISTSPLVNATNTTISTSLPAGATNTAISTSPHVGATKTAISTSLPDATTEDGLSPVMLAAIGGGGGLGLLLLIIILIAVVRHKLRARTVEPSTPKPSQNGQRQEGQY